LQIRNQGLVSGRLKGDFSNQIMGKATPSFYPPYQGGFNMSINSKKFIFFKELQGDHYKYVNLRYFCKTSEYCLEINKHYGCPYEPKILCLKTRQQHYLYNITNDLRKKNHPKTLKEAKERIFEWLEKNKKVDLV